MQAKIKKLFIVDDDQVYHAISSFVLDKFEGVDKVEFYLNGEEAINELKGLKKEDFPDVILLDMNMPIMNGPEFLEAVKEIPDFGKLTKVFIMSTSDRPNDLQHANNEFVHDYYVKPISPRILNKVVASLQQGM